MKQFFIIWQCMFIYLLFEAYTAPMEITPYRCFLMSLGALLGTVLYFAASRLLDVIMGKANGNTPDIRS